MVRHGSAKPITGVRVPSAPPDLTLKVVLRIISQTNFRYKWEFVFLLPPVAGVYVGKRFQKPRL